MHYLVKWRGRSEQAASWVAQSALPDAYAIELAAALEEALAREAEDAADDGDSAGDANESEDDEYSIEMLVQRRMNCRTGRYEYLVRWQGFPPEEDSWEPAEGLPADTRAEFDATQRSASRSRVCTAV